MPAARGIVALVAFGVLAGVAPARADEPRDVAVAPRWEPGDGCLDADSLFAAVEERSRRRPVRTPAEADAIITGRATRAANGGWQVELAVVDRRGALLGRRALTVADPGCPALREHVALVVAMLVDSSLVEGGAVTAPPPALPPPVPPATPRRWSADVALAVLIEAGRLPGATPGVGASAGVTSPRRWRGELLLAAYAEASAEDGSGRTTIRWLAGALAGCAPGLAPGGWRIAACAGVEVGVMTGEGAGFTRNRRDRELVVDAVGRGRIERRLVGPTFLEVAVALRLALRRPRFGYEDETGAFRPLYEPALAGVSGQIGVGAHFP